jgi:arylsulfatase
VIHSFATDVDNRTVEPRWGRVGKQKIEDTGPLTKKCMETIDDDIVQRSADFIERTHNTGKPFFIWVNFPHMNLRTHPKPTSVGRSGRWQDMYHDVMIDHDCNVGIVLAKLDEFGLAENTIVMYSITTGRNANTLSDGATIPFRSEKDTNWEGAYRVPDMVRWPERIRAGTISNEIFGHDDWMPTLLAAAGMSDIKERLMAVYTVGDRTFKVHLDGCNLLPYMTGQQAKSLVPGSSVSPTTVT